MENLEKDLTNLGTAAVSALTKEPYQMQDYEAERTVLGGVGMKTEIGPETDQGDTWARERSVEMVEAVQNLEGVRGLYEPPMGVEDGQAETGRIKPPFKDGESDLPPARRDEGELTANYLGRLKKRENASNEGLRGGRFFPIESTEGRGKLNPTGLEIGFGILVKPEWLGRDKSKWPVINGAPMDVKRGLTPEQVEVFVADKVKEVQGDMAKIVPRWDELAPEVKLYFTDFGFNTGANSIKTKNPTAFKALEEGNPIDAMVSTFDYFNVTRGGEKEATRGLLNRRLNEYNEVARSMGIPEVESYKWGNGRAQVKFNGKLKEGASTYFNKDSVMLRSSNIKEGNVTEHKQTGGQF